MRVQKGPKILGRINERLVDPRADTVLVSSATVVLSGYDESMHVKASLYQSEEDCDRGGYVICLDATGLDDEGLFVPHVVQTPTGIELHLTGDIEGQTFAKALLAILSTR